MYTSDFRQLSTFILCISSLHYFFRNINISTNKAFLHNQRDFGPLPKYLRKSMSMICVDFL